MLKTVAYMCVYILVVLCVEHLPLLLSTASVVNAGCFKCHINSHHLEQHREPLKTPVSGA